MKKDEIEELEKKSEQGDSWSMYILGEIYSQCDGVNHDEKKAFDYYMKAAESGNAMAQYTVGFNFFHGNCVERNYDVAHKWFEKSAKQNCSYAQYMLACDYFYGRGCEKDYKKAFQWFSKAANLDYGVAQKRLADMYWNGDGCESDHKAAIKWYEKAATQGNEYAQKTVADIYYEGNEVEKNFEKAFSLYEKAAEQGNVDAKIALADMYLYGHGCNEDLKKSFELFEDAAMYYNNAYAQYSLGWMYSHGLGVEKDSTMAENCYKNAADQGHAGALYELGRIYHDRARDDYFSEKNQNKAKEYYEKAIENGYDDREKNYEKLKKEMESYFVIEGFISEYSKNKTFEFVKSSDDESLEKKDKLTFSFSISGAEDYSAKRGDKKYNLFYLQPFSYNLLKLSYVASNSIKFNVSIDFENMLLSSVEQHKKIRFVISKTDLMALEEHVDSYELKDIRITLLND